MKRTSIRTRLMIMMICLTTLPVITVTLIATSNTRYSVEREIINANTSRMMWADQYLNELIMQIESSFYTLQINKQLMDSLDDTDNPDRSIQFVTQKYIADTLYSVFYNSSRKVDDMSLYIHSNQKTFSVSFAEGVRISVLNLNDGPWRRMLDMPVNMYFKQSGEGIYIFHSLNRYQDQKLLGGLAVRINRKVWDSVGEILKSEPESSVFIVNDEGEILSGSSQTSISAEIQGELQGLSMKNPELEFYKSKEFFYFKKRIDDGQLSVLKAIPLETVARSARATITAGILTGSIFALVSILLSILFSLRLSRPIVSLAKTMRTAQIRDFKVKPVQSTDEIGLLEHGYNIMMQRIKELIEDEYQKNIELKNAQLVALQAQINPHFLNNTLNLIGGMALTKNAPEIYQVTRTIGDLLRYAISDEGNLVSLNNELKHMNNYIYIQEHRFLGRCKVNLSVDEMLFDCKLPKFTLQPIVENAFEHGLQKKEGMWKVDIRIKLIGKRVSIIIRDNGIGLSEESLKLVRGKLLSRAPITSDQTETVGGSKRKGIGLQNVNARLKLHFGRRFGARIFSRQGKGTVVVLMLPVQEKEIADVVQGFDN